MWGSRAGGSEMEHVVRCPWRPLGGRLLQPSGRLPEARPAGQQGPGVLSDPSPFSRALAGPGTEVTELSEDTLAFRAAPFLPWTQVAMLPCPPSRG